MGGEIVVGYRGGGGQSFSPYGHTRGQAGFNDEKRETKTLHKFQAEWAIKHGPKFTAYNNAFGGRLREDSEEITAERQRLYGQYKK